MTILLSDDEIETLEYEILHRYFPSQHFKGIRKSWEYDFLNNIAKAQAKKIFAEIEGYEGSYIDKRFWHCGFWQTLKKEVE